MKDSLWKVIMILAVVMASSQSWAWVEYQEGSGWIPAPVLWPAPADIEFPPRWDNFEASDGSLQGIGMGNIYNPDADPNFLWGKIPPNGQGPRAVLGSGFGGLFHRDNPERPIGSQYAAAGMFNPEHWDSPLLSDFYRSTAFTQRKEACNFETISSSEFQLHWPPRSWPLDLTVRYSLQPGGYIDIDITIVVTGVIATPELHLMCASYMAGLYQENRDGTRPECFPRSVYFGPNFEDQLGRSDQIGNPATGNKRGWAVAGVNSPPLSYLASKNGLVVYDLNLKRWEYDSWTVPTWFSHVDGDGLEQTKDPYILQHMFAQQNVTLQTHNWGPQPWVDQYNWTTSAWDYSIVIYGAEVGNTYCYQARIYYGPASVDSNGDPDHPLQWEESVTRRVDWMENELEQPADENQPVIRFIRDERISDDLVEISKWEINQDSQSFDPKNLVDYIVDNEEGPYFVRGQAVPLESGAIAELSITSNVNTKQAGTYEVKVQAMDATGNIATRALPVEVKATPDTIAPTIALNGSPAITIVKGSVFTDPGVVANDNRDRDQDLIITKWIKNPQGSVRSSINTNSPGRWTIEYQAADTSKNKSLVISRTVTITDPMARSRWLELLLQLILGRRP